MLWFLFLQILQEIIMELLHHLSKFTKLLWVILACFGNISYNVYALAIHLLM